MTALFEQLEDGVFLPQARARGPWDKNALHGGPVAALLAREVERTESDGPMHVARLSVELLRPVPVAPLTVAASLLRPGRKVQLVGASVTTADGAEVARMTALRIRAGHVDMPDLQDKDRLEAPPPMGTARARPRLDQEWEAFHNDGVEMRFTSGFFGEQGPATVWMRLCQPVLEDEAPTPVQRVASHADFGNGVSSVVPWSDYLFINPDLTIHLARPPEGEWVCLEARSLLAPEDGMGMAESALYDERGRVGRSVQSLLVDRR